MSDWVKKADVEYQLARRLTERLRGTTPGKANASKRQHTYVHKRNLDDNETTLCGSTDEGAATIDWSEVNCPRCLTLRETEEAV